MKKFWLIIAAICVILIAYSLYNIYSIPKYVQVQSLSPEIEKLQINNKKSTELYIGEQSVSFGASGANAKHRAVNYKYFDTYFVKLIDGRLFYNDEKENTAIIDEKLSLILYPSVSPIGRDVKIGENTYKVVGVIKNAPYTTNSINAFIPLKYAQMQKIKGKFLVHSVDTSKQSRSEFLEDAKYDGIWDIEKEREKSILLFKICVYILVLFAVNYFRRRLSLFLRSRFAELKVLNQDKYPREYWPNISIFIIQCVIGYAIVAGVMAGGLYYLVASAVKVPEYIPEILVDFNMIYEKYLDNIRASSSLYYLKTDAMIALQHHAHLINTEFTVLLLSLCSKFFNERKN